VVIKHRVGKYEEVVRGGIGKGRCQDVGQIGMGQRRYQAVGHVVIM
jgi:hypothetical protein